MEYSKELKESALNDIKSHLESNMFNEINSRIAEFVEYNLKDYIDNYEEADNDEERKMQQSYLKSVKDEIFCRLGEYEFVVEADGLRV